VCEANAYFSETDGSLTLCLESVDRVEPTSEGLLLTTIFGEQRFVRGRIVRLELVDHKIVLERA
jgi:predicted RNA-binding protein